MVRPLLGTDVSDYQGHIDWKQYAASGYSFSEIKATEGLYDSGTTFPYNWHQSRANGVIRIAYHFLRPEYDGARQADILHRRVRNSGHFIRNDGVMLDLEEMDNQSPYAVVKCAESFVERILSTTECGVILYCNYDFWVNQLGNPRSTILGRCPLHQASWHSRPAPIDNWPSGPALQQYAADGRVPGIQNQVDLDWAFCDKRTLRALCRLGGRR